jgi:hypothetical protein
VRCPVLVERDDELRLLSRMGSNVSAAGDPGVAAITGEAGTGKTRLAHEFAASLPEQWTVETVRVTRTAAGLPRAGAARPLALIVDDTANWRDSSGAVSAGLALATAAPAASAP